MAILARRLRELAGARSSCAYFVAARCFFARGGCFVAGCSFTVAVFLVAVFLVAVALVAALLVAVAFTCFVAVAFVAVAFVAGAFVAFVAVVFVVFVAVVFVAFVAVVLVAFVGFVAIAFVAVVVLAFLGLVVRAGARGDVAGTGADADAAADAAAAADAEAAAPECATVVSARRACIAMSTTTTVIAATSTAIARRERCANNAASRWPRTIIVSSAASRTRVRDGAIERRGDSMVSGVNVAVDSGMTAGGGGNAPGDGHTKPVASGHGGDVGIRSADVTTSSSTSASFQPRSISDTCSSAMIEAGPRGATAAANAC